MAAVLLALGASLSFGFADFYGGLSSRRAALVAVMAGAQVAGLAVIAVVVAVRAAPFPGAGILPWTVLAAFIGMAALACLYRGLAVGSMSVVAPIAATAAVIPVVVGAARGEAPAALQNAGIALALGGVLLASRAPGGATPRRFAQGAGLGILAALFIGVFLVVFDAAAEHDPYWASLLLRATSALLLLTVALVTRPSFRLGGRLLGVIALVGVLDMAGNTLFAVASTKGLVGVVSVLSSLYPVVTVALARLLLAERMRRSQGVGVAAAFAGVGLIAVG